MDLVTFELLFQQGYGYHRQGQLTNAKSCYQQALQIQPQHFDSLHLLGLIAGQEGEPELAVKLIGQAVRLKSDNAVAHFNLGKALQDIRQYSDALASYETALAINPGYAAAHCNAGVALEEIKRYDEALLHLEEALYIRPDYPFLRGSILGLKMRICDWGGFPEKIKDISSRVKNGECVITPFAALCAVDLPKFHKKVSEIWVKSRYKSSSDLINIRNGKSNSKIRIGYFSADFHGHATSYLMAELFELHDRTKFELLAFSFGPEVSPNDAMRPRLIKAFDRLMDVRNIPGGQVAKLSRELGIDIAVDLKGHTKDACTGIFAARAAPIQVSYLGYPGTMGADFIDYIIADRVAIPEGNQTFYSEKIVYLPNCYQVNDRKRPISNRVFSRQELGLPRVGFVFCCFNNSFKITPMVFDVWMKLLLNVEGSVLWLFEGVGLTSENLRRNAALRGVDPSRLVFAGSMPLPDHLARHNLADLFLDTIPYNAHTTASDALWAGLPVLTCAGESFAGRVAASLLTAIGLPELVTTSLQAYERKAMELATQPHVLDEVRHKLRVQRLTTPLFDTSMFCRHLEDAYESMQDRRLAGLAPDHIAVT